MVRTLWLALGAAAAALAMTVGASAAGGGGDHCPGGYEPLTLVGLDDPLIVYNDNGNGYICVYLGDNKKKDVYIDDNEKPAKKHEA